MRWHWIFACRLRSLPVLVLPVLLMACSEPEAPGPADTELVQSLMQDPMALARGQALFAGSCANFCHEIDSPAATVNLFDCEWEHGSTDQELFDIITNGIPETRMVAFGGNWPEGDIDLWRLIAYLRHNQANCDDNG